MSFLKKLFGGETKPEREHVPRQPRVKIGSLHRIEFLRVGQPSARLANVSTLGMGLIKADAESANVGDRISGELKIGERSYPTSATVRHASGVVVGCEFNDVTHAMARAIEEYFRIEILGLKLRRMNPQYMKADPEGTPAWFTDGGSNELYFVQKDGAIRRFHMSILGNYLEGGEKKPVRTGHVVDENDQAGHDGGRLAKASAMVELNPEASRQAIELARQLIRIVAELEPKDRDALEGLLGAADLRPLK